MLASLNADLFLALGMFFAAMLYSSVGHAGASAYIALMAMFGVPPLVMRPTALVLNIIVASFATLRFGRAGLFRWRVLWPFLLGSLPMAFLGGAIRLPGEIYKPLVGAVLLVTATRLLWPRPLPIPDATKDPNIPVAVAIGAGIGLLSGLTGTGGGIFLSPLLLFFGWTPTKTASGIAAAFILSNSIAGLSGNMAAIRQIPASLPLFAVAVLAGAVIGTTLGIRLATPLIQRALGVVLAIAGMKLLLVP